MESGRPPSVAGARPTGVVLDRAVLAQLVGDLGAAPVLELCTLFLRDAAERVSVIGHALEAGDAGTAARAAHRLKSAAGFVGASALAARSTAIERLTGSGTTSEARPLWAPLLGELERTSEEMARLLEELGPHRWSAATP